MVFSTSCQLSTKRRLQRLNIRHRLRNNEYRIGDIRDFAIYRERLFEKTDSFTQSIFAFQHGTNTIYIYSLGTCHSTFRSCGGLTFSPPNQKNFFARNKNQSFFLTWKISIFPNFAKNISFKTVRSDWLLLHLSGQYTIVLYNMQRQYIVKKKAFSR